MKHIYSILFLLLNSLYSNAQNLPPVAVDDYDTLITGGLKPIMLKLNDFDPDGDSFILDSVFYSGNKLEILHVYLNHIVVIADFYASGNDLIKYTIKDVNGGIDTGYIHIYIKYVNYERQQIFQTPKTKLPLNSDGLLGPDYFTASYGYSTNENMSLVYVILNSLIFKRNNIPFHSNHLYSGNGSSQSHSGPVTDSIYVNQQDSLWNRFWNLSKTEIIFHINNWYKPWYQMPEAISSWPAHGNPNIGQAQSLAPFVDVDQNGIFEPHLGDYPKIKGDRSVFWITNSNEECKSERFGFNNCENTKEKLETHYMVYALDCNDSALINTIFIEETFINRSNLVFDSCMIGTLMDTDIGCYIDDHIGTDVKNHSIYGYNATPTMASCVGIYVPPNEKPPVVNFTLLQGPLRDSNGIDDPDGCRLLRNGNNGLTDDEELGLYKTQIANFSYPLGGSSLHYFNWHSTLYDSTNNIHYHYIYPDSSDMISLMSQSRIGRSSPSWIPARIRS